ncbi:hypothetical protein SRABI130_05724 [Pseudomonas sp. Bi130]|uniref:hypothetical protein n=1 Tax=Pseudomonas sp. Bi130 TaxID=2821122 RepID=UPI001D9B03FC|nr:hypothetical protein [Pseudomonas sp. Bi130]CAH0322105.1 hypothetical protein SRABI130_05724 [Pseudomonas sp. Bi130]
MKYEKTLRKLCRVPKLAPEQIIAVFKKHESIDVEIIAKDIGKPGFEIRTDEGLCFVTERPIDYYNKRWGRVTGTQERALGLSILLPLHLVGEGDLIKAIYHINKSDNPKLQADNWLHEIFSIEVLATYFNKFFSTSNSLSEYKTIIFEAIEAYCIGMDHVAIMSLIPVFEAGLRNIQNARLNTELNNVSAQVFEQRLKEIIVQWGLRRLDSYIWHPGKHYNAELEIDFLTHICPQSDVINAFRMFFKKVLYKPSSGNTDGFNRHLIIHMLKNDFNNPANFLRIFLCLTHITFIESLENNNVPFSWRGIDSKDMQIAAYLRQISKNFGDPRRPLLRLLGIGGYDSQPTINTTTLEGKTQ